MEKKYWFLLGGLAIGWFGYSSISTFPGVTQIGNLGFNVGAGNGFSTVGNT